MTDTKQARAAVEERGFAMELLDAVANGEVSPAGVDWSRVADAIGKAAAENAALRAENAALRAALSSCADGLRNIGKHLIKGDCFNAGQELDPCPCSLCKANRALAGGAA